MFITRKSMLLIIIFISFTRSLSADKTIFDCDFTKSLPKGKPTLVRASITDGMLRVGKTTGKFWASATFPVAIDSPFIITFNMRVTGVSQPDNRLGFTLKGPDEQNYQFCSPDGGNSYVVLVTKKRKIREKKTFAAKTKIEKGASEHFVLVEARVENNFIEMKVNGKFLGVIPLNFLPVKEIEFFSMNAKIQIDNIKIVELGKVNENYCDAPVFRADFNDSVNAVDENGKPIVPTSKSAPALLHGMNGNALASFRGKKFKTLTYDIGPILGDAGAIMFWSSPQERFLKTIRLLDKDGKERLDCMAQGFGYAMKLVRPDGSEYSFFTRGSKYQTHRGSWNHYAMTWDRTGAIRVFRNGLPYVPSYAWESNVGFSSGMNLSDVRKLQILESCGSLIDNLKLFRKKVTVDEVYHEFRKNSPLDIVIANAVVEPEKEAAFTLELAPGGTYTQAIHSGKLITNVKGELKLTLRPLKHKIQTLKTLTRSFEVKDKPIKIEFPVGELPESKYLVMCEIKFSDGRLMSRGIFTECLALPDKAPTATTKDIELGKLVFSKKFTSADDKSILCEGNLHVVDGEYLEPGDNNGDRFSIVVPNLEDYIQKPMILEITWPDNKQRMMGLYVYHECKGQAFRDRLEGGVQAGREIPNSGKMVKTRYLIYPQSPTFLFEARTLGNGFPAAVAELKLYEIKGGRLPKLKINYPKGMPHRRIGVIDEDQTLRVTLATKEDDLKSLTERILNYMDYTGQDSFHTQMLRYWFGCFPYPGHIGRFTPLPGTMGYLIDAMGKRGKEFTGIINLGTIPEVYYASCLDRDLSQTGMISLDKDSFSLAGNKISNGKPNIACPAVREAYVRYIADLADYLRRPAVKAVSLWKTMGWESLEDGYDNYTVNKFSEETGIQVPDLGRYKFLTSEKILPKWSEWRAKQVFELVKMLRKALDKIKPELLIYVMKRGDHDWNSYLDPMLKKLPRTYACDFRRPTHYRWDFHWNRPEKDWEEKLYDYPANQALRQWKSNQFVASWYAYYETYVKPLLHKKYGCYFQSADVKPHGRHFLKELAFNVAATDALEIGFGGQPFGSWGRDEETREFARAFAALPHQSFNTVPGSSANVTARYLNTDNGAYLYLVSGVWTDSKAIFKWPENMAYTDLSTNEKLTGGTIELKPYELRSFLLPAKKVKIDSFCTEFPERLKKFYLRRVAKLETAVEIFEKRGVSVSDEKTRIRQIKEALKARNYAETHRLAWSTLMNQMLKNLKVIDLVAEQNKMIERNHFALNCGDSDFYRTLDGRLFFPDREYSDSSRYGNYGSHSCATRKTGKLKDKKEPGLFKSEAYNADGYKFKLPNGKYLVRLYMKVAWINDFKPGKVVFSVYANSKPLFIDLDLYKTQNGDYNQPVIKDFHVLVNNGMLTLTIKAAKGLGKNIQLCNAIEVIPEK